MLKLNDWVAYAQLRLQQRSKNATFIPQAITTAAPLDLRIVGRVVFHAVTVGIAAGVMGAVFFVALEYAQVILLERIVGYLPLRAHGESFVAFRNPASFRPWLLAVLPAIGGLLCGIIVQFAREARGGGGDATIEAFHQRGGIIRRRVIWIKTVASLFTLGSGGSGGREGPTMLIGGAIGSLTGRVLRVSSRERRILLVAGVAAGISAVFRTPLGAALLAVEFLYQDGFEADALIPSVLASVVSYSVVIALYGETTLFGHVPRFPFVLSHLPLYALMALLVSAVGAVFVSSLRTSRRFFSSLPVPVWARPAFGGLALGVFATPILVFVGRRVGVEGRGLGLLGGGYGAVQTAITGADWLPKGWFGVELLVMLAFAKLVTASLTIGSEGSAGDFAPSLAIGGLLGGAFGNAMVLVLPSEKIVPGAFALVGMGVLYGGVAHVPLSALILVCELAGNYDLLVPLMLALGISFVALKRVSLYEAQVPTLADSPVHRNDILNDVLRTASVRDVVPKARTFHSFYKKTTANEMLETLVETDWQDVFPVLDESRRVIGLVTAEALQVVAVENEEMDWVLASDLMRSPVSVTMADDLRTASERLLINGLRDLPVVDENGMVIALLDETDLSQWSMGGAVELRNPITSPSRPNGEGPIRPRRKN
jgi:CIC family chloride channel protein